MFEKPKGPRPFSETSKFKLSSKNNPGKKETTKKNPKALDYSSNDVKEATTTDVLSTLVDQTDMGIVSLDGIYEAPEQKYTPTKETKQGFLSFFSNLTSRVFKPQDLEPIKQSLVNHLIQKNVAADVAEILCSTVCRNLEGTQVGTFTSTSNLVREHLEVAIKMILTPATSTDVLRDILAAKAEGRPYTIVFIGVNGVGKSTNLSKVCFWLLQNKLKVLVAACDTFRSGAVEQLLVHVRNLRNIVKDSGGKVDLFEKGYGKDAASIAKDAIQNGILLVT